jgi:hypothetical protein
MWGTDDGMGIGVGIFLIALGAILAFAVDWTVGGLDLHVVGWILMIVGVGGLILFFYLWNRSRVPEAVGVLRQRRVSSQSATYNDPTPPPPETVTTVTAAAPPPPPATVTTVAAAAPVAPPPETVTTVTAAAAVPAASRARPDAGPRQKGV